MKRSLITLLCSLSVILLTGCTSTRWVNTGGYWLESVDASETVQNPTLSDEGVYADDRLQVKLEMLDDCFALNIKNLSNQPLSLRWSECSYTDEMGKTHKIMHTENTLGIVQFPTFVTEVKGGTTYEDFIAPADVSGYDDEGYLQLTPLWRIHSYKSKSEAEKARPDSSVVRVSLAIQQGEVIDDYIFTFAGDDYQTSKIEELDEKKALFSWDLTLVSMIVLFALTWITN